MFSTFPFGALSFVQLSTVQAQFQFVVSMSVSFDSSTTTSPVAAAFGNCTQQCTRKGLQFKPTMVIRFSALPPLIRVFICGPMYDTVYIILYYRYMTQNSTPPSHSACSSSAEKIYRSDVESIEGRV